MLIVALALAVIGLAALVTAVVTSNVVVAWVCIGASALGVVLLVVDAIRERQQRRIDSVSDEIRADEIETPATEFDDEPDVEAGPMESEQQAEIEAEADMDADRDETGLAADIADEDHPDEVIHDEPEFDTYSDDEQEFPAPAEESALHVVEDTELDTRGVDER